NLFDWCWAAWLLIWLALSFRNKRTARRENLGSWTLHMLPIMLAAVLLATDWTPWPALQREVLPYRAAWYWIGLALTAGGLLRLRPGDGPVARRARLRDRAGRPLVQASPGGTLDDRNLRRRLPRLPQPLQGADSGDSLSHRRRKRDMAGRARAN